MYSIERLQKTGANILGCIINDVDKMGNTTYHYQNYGYGYAGSRSSKAPKKVPEVEEKSEASESTQSLQPVSRKEKKRKSIFSFLKNSHQKNVNKDLVAQLNAGKTTFKEKGLDELFDAARAYGVQFTTEYQVTDTYIISVPTPYNKFSKKVDASYVIEALKDVMQVCPKGATIVIESTISPGTIDRYVRPVVEAGGFEIGKEIHLVHAPERIIPGNMVTQNVLPVNDVLRHSPHQLAILTS